MNFCSHCGHSVRFAIPEGDDRGRFLCDACGTVHYQNPRIVAGTLPVSDGRVLLCRRAIAPRLGYWTLPAGFMENGETTSEAAARETREEACAEVDLRGLYTMISLPHIDQVYMIFRGDLRGDYAPGPESLEVALFSEAEIPWHELAFPTIERTLRHYFDDRLNDDYPLHVSDITAEDRERYLGSA
ncbi:MULTISPECIES: NUDIX hydrolase [Chromohalobacter]|jgi:ADP-ribose pyrophosphatase YjhB (NUDIX family)|uniref:NUDIX hydrolase n=1 Tax=Chromohalobacter israelensis (strain ATCC BAA-138 / DSM 3043 / CIP 106854 / NCIMB 13768 / 1H11) TaxID=290398 RepID=Q1QU70_CHRI1|nr:MULTISPECIES: NUDIX hydrolase [Chromohalobacter]ABE59988.1 NUDIX hydrolase [Chromohalobacter salexigens DSM 3043]MBZ5875808.1 NUDIX hydrolase [Chromohalobacter salexigens]MDF9435314.1 NUDIX hydrolase [Chromohalobacter israelensis]MDO0945789.1 NUDIX hydrolase [Chromohalobacter salexigens]NQY44946.1 NUDIX hydrolase [Chromohalobacter sp.]